MLNRWSAARPGSVVAISERLALGAGQLQPLYFALEVLEVYRNDPRHPAFYQRSILGDFSERESMFTAFTAELAQLQEMCAAAGIPPIVRESYDEGEKPPHFTFLIRPTPRNFRTST